jgi:hypothetical protein
MPLQCSWKWTQNDTGSNRRRNDRRRYKRGRSKNRRGNKDLTRDEDEAPIYEERSLREEEAAVDEAMVDEWAALEGKATADECAARVPPGQSIRGSRENRSATEQDHRGSNLHQQPPFCWRKPSYHYASQSGARTFMSRHGGLAPKAAVSQLIDRAGLSSSALFRP